MSFIVVRRSEKEKRKKGFRVLKKFSPFRRVIRLQSHPDPKKIESLNMKNESQKEKKNMFSVPSNEPVWANEFL